MRDTIFAPGHRARAGGGGGGARFRAGSGAGADGAGARRRPTPRQATVRTLRDGAARCIDEALVLWFPGPDSYTGEDVAELQLHGGAAVVDAGDRSARGDGLRLAEPGEFTRRAFESTAARPRPGRGVADLVDAETEAQARQALAQLDGRARPAARWPGATSGRSAGAAGGGGGLPRRGAAGGRAPLAAPAGSPRWPPSSSRALAEGGRGERVREGYRIALIGAPNAGKSRAS